MSLEQLANVKTRSPLKVSIIFALGILLPSGFLSFLGLRSYRYEARLMQKETEERFSEVADLVEKKVTVQLSDLISSLQKVADQPSFQRSDEASLYASLLAKPKLNGLPTEAMFVFNEADHMVAPWQAESESTGRSSVRHDIDWGPLADDIDRLERLEFAQKDIAGALRGYIALQSRAIEPSQQINLLKIIAGNYRKLHQNRQAEATYEKLAHAYDQHPDFSGYPTGVVARQMAIELYDEDKAWSKALDTRLDLFEGMLFHRWSLHASQRKTLLAELRTAIERIVSRHPIEGERATRWRHLQDVQARLDTLEQASSSFAKEEWPTLLQRVRKLGHIDQGTVLQTTSPNRSIALLVPIRSRQADHRRGLLVALLSPSVVWPAINSTMVETTPNGLTVDWAYTKAQSHKSHRLWQQRVQREIRAIDPPLTFSLMDTASSARDELFRRRQWIFGGMIGLSFIVIIVGLVIMGKAVKRETEVANLKADFVANVSHELRTPLAAISHIGERLSLGRYRSEDERKEFYDLLGKETGRLRLLIEDILDFSKILAGKKVYRSELVDLNELVDQSLTMFQPKADARGFTVTAQLAQQPVPILGDARALTQSILNLLDNALKYSGDARKIDVNVSANGQQGIVAVTDHGIGIAEADKEKIFEKFYRLEQPGQPKDAGGVGLGLAMVKHVVEGHKGEIIVDSKVGRGTTFSLVFPLRLSKGQAANG